MAHGRTSRFGLAVGARAGAVTMAAVPVVHEQVHQRAEQEEEEGKRPEEVRAVLGEEEEGGDRQKQHVPTVSAVLRLPAPASTRFMPQVGQRPGSGHRTFGCIGQVYVRHDDSMSCIERARGTPPFLRFLRARSASQERARAGLRA